MTREIERAGIPVAQICAVINVALAMGANRILPSPGVLYPTGSPSLPPAEEVNLRRRLVGRALAAVRTGFDQAKVLASN